MNILEESETLPEIFELDEQPNGKYTEWSWLIFGGIIFLVVCIFFYLIFSRLKKHEMITSPEVKTEEDKVHLERKVLYAQT
ncbi:hypothetical protein MM239_05375 [Belliella sp. DSM 111904]|uniref:Cbb3-type cytochrome oxidase component FixQ n=1 Tax=Belliella filtrata TaxID=2923435 RepID=A0ABS9UXA5_9BACT|nr:hypothetical protein [Belliella filtrata]MCH7408817.1 hypothetical protein [Belliella filtrata]